MLYTSIRLSLDKGGGSVVRMRQAPSRIVSATLDLLFPRRCAGCEEEGSFLCARCEETLPRLTAPFCRLCAQPLPSGDVCSRCREAPLPGLEGIRAPYLMDGLARDCVHKLKYQDFRAMAGVLGGLLTTHVADMGLPASVLVPVPLHTRRLRARGYNQSALLAREMGRRMDIPVAERALRRTRAAPPQARSANLEERRRNVEGSFTVRDGALSGSAVLLVDDVCTTGNTLAACAVALKAAGAASVWAATVAREA